MNLLTGQVEHFFIGKNIADILPALGRAQGLIGDMKQEFKIQ